MVKLLNSKKLILVSLLTFSFLALASEKGTAAAGFGNIVTYLKALFDTMKIVLFFAGAILVIINALKLLGGAEFSQVFQQILLAVFLFGLGYGISSIIGALGGAIIDNYYLLL